MVKRFTRQQLQSLVWEKPMTKLAADFGLSDVALHKICRRHRVPTPPAGYWAKKAYGKRVTTTALPDPADQTEITIRESSASNEPQAIAEARLTMLAAAQAAASTTVPNPIVERTLSKLRRMCKGADGLVRSQTGVRMSVRPESFERASAILGQFVAAAEQGGLELVQGSEGAAWLCDDETMQFELVEVADQIEHVATEKELAAVAQWKRKREEDHRRYGYWRDWGEPRIPKWEHRYQGRLAIRLEEVRVQSEQSWWGPAVRRTFSDTRTRDVSKVIPHAVAAIAAIAAAKKHNREMEARRRAAEQERARRRERAERHRAQEQMAIGLAGELIEEQEAAERLRSLLTVLGPPEADHPRTAAFIRWAQDRLAAADGRITRETIEQLLEGAGLFGSDEAEETG
jgi:hypothetical protein